MFIDHSYANALSELVSSVSITELSNPKLETVNSALVEQLGIPEDIFYQENLFKHLFEINGLFNKKAVAQKYGGHQFGVWNPDLGDGRGLLLGEIETPDKQRLDLHLKGAGQTPYSRFGDGRAVLRSTIREYLASEALHSLGIPTSRALCLISSDETVYRETPETAAMMIRTCPSHIRFGHFEFFYHSGQKNKLNALMDYTIETHFPQLLSNDNPHYGLLEHITTVTAQMVAKWQAQGFCHGVMNTDNMSIHGITFDYGPYAFLDAYDPQYICNHSDHNGRYGFDQQPGVALWNLNALAHAFTPYLSIEQIKQALQQYEPCLQQHYAQIMTQKLGLVETDTPVMTVLNQFLNLLQQEKQDYTQSFRLLSQLDKDPSVVIDHFIDRDSARSWVDLYQVLIQQQNPDHSVRQRQMNSINPKYILRNYLAQQAIDQAQQGNYEYFHTLLKVLSAPFEEQPEYHNFAATPPDWGQAMEISCSS